MRTHVRYVLVPSVLYDDHVILHLEFGLVLAEVTVASDSPVAYRQVGSIYTSLQSSS